MLKVFASTIAALFITASAASALTVTNTSDKEISIGLDMGDKEAVHKIAAGKSANFDKECKDGCGLTGPWGYSKWAMAGDKVETDGKPLVTVD